MNINRERWEKDFPMTLNCVIDGSHFPSALYMRLYTVNVSFLKPFFFWFFAPFCSSDGSLPIEKDTKRGALSIAAGNSTTRWARRKHRYFMLAFTLIGSKRGFCFVSFAFVY